VIKISKKKAIEMQIKTDGQEIIDELDFKDSDLEVY